MGGIIMGGIIMGGIIMGGIIMGEGGGGVIIKQLLDAALSDIFILSP